MENWLDMLNVSVTDPVSANPAAVYGKNSYSMILTPAGGLDFPLRRGGTAFVEVRFDYRITDLIEWSCYVHSRKWCEILHQFRMLLH